MAPYFDTNDLIGKTIYLNKTVSHYYKNPIVKTLKLKVAGYSDYVKVNEFTKNKVNALQRDMIGKLIPLNKLNENALKKAIENGATTMDGNSTTYSLTYEALNLYHNIFIMVQYLLLAMLLIYFFIYSIKSIKEKSYQIGVFKSLGLRNYDINFIFLGKTIIVAFLSIIFASIIAYPFLKLANFLLLSSYSALFNNNISNLNIFYFHPYIFLFHYLMNIVLFILISFYPLFKLKKVEPAKIVNNAND